jgi:hypothetical protein
MGSNGIDFDLISKLERSLGMEKYNSKDEIDNAIGEVIRRDAAKGKLKVQDNEKLIELRKRIIEDVKEMNHPIRRWIKNLFKKS